MSLPLDSFTLEGIINGEIAGNIGTLTYSSGKTDPALWFEDVNREDPETPRVTGLEVVVRRYVNEQMIVSMGTRRNVHSDYQIFFKQWTSGGYPAIAARDLVESALFCRGYATQNGPFLPRNERLRSVEEARLTVTYRRI